MATAGAPPSGGILSNLAALFSNPQTYNWLGGVGAGLSRAGHGQGFDITGVNTQFLQALQNEKAKEKLNGLMQNFDLSTQQRQFIQSLPLQAQQKILAQQQFGGGKSPNYPSSVREAQFMYPNDPEAQRRYIEQKATKPLVQMGDTGPQIGTIKPGWQVEKTPEGAWRMSPIPGGPAAQEQEKAAAAAQGRQSHETRAAGVVLEDIGRIKKRIENSVLPVTGFFGSLIKEIPGTNAYDVSALTQTARANIGFDRLQQMREESPTGGALGQVSNLEINTLQAVLGNLDQAQSEKQFLENLNRLEKIYKRIMDKAAAYPNAEKYGFSGGAAAGGAAAGAKPVSEMSTDELMKMYQGSQ